MTISGTGKIRKNEVRQCRHDRDFRFKGMETPAVVIIDVEDAEGEKIACYLYVGATRALQKAVVPIKQ